MQLVSSSMIVAIVISMLIAVGSPIVLFIIFKKKYGISVKVVLFGMLTFFLFAQVLEGIAHQFFLIGNETTRTWLENPWLYMLYGGLMAGVFEETGRYVVMAYALKKYREWKDGLAFGLGHGGIEAILLVGVNSVIMIVYALMINNGSFDLLMIDEQVKAALEPVRAMLTEGPAYIQVLGGIERLGAIAIHLGLSILVMYAVTSKQKKYWLYAILIHALFNFPAALYQAGVIKSILAVEAYVLLAAVGAVVWIVKSRKLFSGKLE